MSQWYGKDLSCIFVLHPLSTFISNHIFGILENLKALWCIYILCSYQSIIVIFISIYRKRHLPSIEDAWNLPISAEITSRQQQQQQQQQPGGPSYKYGTTPTGPPPPYPQAQAQNPKRFKVEMFTYFII